MHFDSAQWGIVCFQAESVFIDNDGSISTHIKVPSKSGTLLCPTKILNKAEPNRIPFNTCKHWKQKKTFALLFCSYNLFIFLPHYLLNTLKLLHRPFKKKWVNLPTLHNSQAYIVLALSQAYKKPSKMTAQWVGSVGMRVYLNCWETMGTGAIHCYEN